MDSLSSTEVLVQIIRNAITENISSGNGNRLLLNDDKDQQMPSINESLSEDKINASSHNPYVLPWWLQVSWATTYGVMMAVAILGNAIVIWAVLCHRVMRTPTNYFLVNVSVADFMMATFNAIFNFIFMINSDWPFGSTYCTFNNFMATVTVAASVLSLTAISVDRYTAIMQPLKPRMSKKMAGLVIVVIWVAGCLLSLPNLIYSTTQYYFYYDGSLRTLCFLQWPDGPSFDSTSDYIYNVVIMVMTYLLPVTAMSIVYLQMGRELWGSKGIGECCDNQVKNLKSKRRVVRMFIVVVTIFVICWLPYHLYFLYVPLNKEVIETDYIQHVFLAFYWLAMSNAMYNPIIYFKMNARFRRYFITVIRCCRPTSSGQTTSGNSCMGQSAGTTLTIHQPSMCERMGILRKPSDGRKQLAGNGEQKSAQPIHYNLVCIAVKQNKTEENGNIVVQVPTREGFGFFKWWSIKKSNSIPLSDVL